MYSQWLVALGQTTRYRHDALGRLRHVVGPDGSEHRYDYDAQGNLTGYTDPQGAATRYAYNGLDQPVLRQDALGGTLRYQHDAVGRLVALQNENGATTRFTYDAADNLIEEIGFDGRIQRYRYNAAGELAELHERDARQPPDTPYDPDPAAPLPKRTVFRRDAVGRLVAKAHLGPEGREEAAGSGGVTTFAYDLLGRMLQAGNADARVHFAYDPLSRLVEEVQEHLAPEGTGTLGRYAWRHAYDALGNRTDSRMPGGRHVQWLYYGSGHLHQIRVDGHVLSDIERDALHQEIERTQGALESRYGWDPMGRLVAHKVGRRQALQGQPGMPSPQALRDRDQGLPAMPNLPSGDRIARQYRYDPAGHLIATRDGLRGDSHYRYDPLGRILAAQRGDHKQQATERETFAFDPAGNLLNPNRGGAQSSGGVGQREVVPYNRLAVYQDLRFTYDLHGNTIERRIGWHTVQHYRYSPEHQIVEARVVRYRERPAEGDAEPAPATTEQVTHYRYDALGRRIDKRDAFGRTAFLYDGDLLAGELRGSRLSEYLYEPDSFVPLAKLESEWKGEAADKEKEEDKESARPKDFAAYYYQCDQIGAPQELTDEQGRIVWAASYQVWGQTRALQVMRTGTDDAAVFTQAERPLALAAKGDVQALSFVEQPLRFQGQYFDGETGLHYNRFRYYDPVTGRFLHQDPIGLLGGTNLFIYAVSPTNWADLLGLTADKLGRNLRRAGRPLQQGQTPHHIVQENCKKNRHVQNSRDILGRNNIGIDDASNGARLWGTNPAQTATANHPGSAAARAAGNYHAGPHVHSDMNDKLIYQILKGVEKRGGNVEEALKDIGRRLESGSWKYTFSCCCK
ncbi:hypothetical protein C7Y68_15350 [Paracidovorax avenae]|uniref:RHS repeat-associated core domain-containing protein n=1 Tax=Paracidovorax avenae TaxID=80867 RepID=UPI000D16A547|nr:RHS repeat-associated core domain-containing protein [Paracidovorax avenae]AVT06835.1 hypothetical protein C8248_13320 [Paracidovorax avenae]AVT21200.1 hypothetical protein C7Y68_15350 [Paracidovorax avenae]